MQGWDERLSCLQKQYYAVVRATDMDGVLVVEETTTGGEARVEFPVQAGCKAVSLALSGPRMFPFLHRNKNADGHLLVERPDGRWTAHVVECKRTLTLRKWQHAQEQLRCSLVRLQLLADFLGLDVAERVTWVASRRDEVSTNTSAIRASSHPAVRDVLAWQCKMLDEVPFSGRVACHHIPLDSAGNGRQSV